MLDLILRGRSELGSDPEVQGGRGEAERESREPGRERGRQGGRRGAREGEGEPGGEKVSQGGRGGASPGPSCQVALWSETDSACFQQWVLVALVGT